MPFSWPINFPQRACLEIYACSVSLFSAMSLECYLTKRWDPNSFFLLWHSKPLRIWPYCSLPVSTFQWPTLTPVAYTYRGCICLFYHFFPSPLTKNSDSAPVNFPIQLKKYLFHALLSMALATWHYNYPYTQSSPQQHWAPQGRDYVLFIFMIYLLSLAALQMESVTWKALRKSLTDKWMITGMDEWQKYQLLDFLPICTVKHQTPPLLVETHVMAIQTLDDNLWCCYCLPYDMMP